MRPNIILHMLKWGFLGGVTGGTLYAVALVLLLSGGFIGLVIFGVMYGAIFGGVPGLVMGLVLGLILDMVMRRLPSPEADEGRVRRVLGGLSFALTLIFIGIGYTTIFGGTDMLGGLALVMAPAVIAAVTATIASQKWVTKALAASKLTKKKAEAAAVAPF